MGPLTPLFWTSGDVCPGFQSQSGVAPADLLVANMTAEPFQSTYLHWWARVKPNFNILPKHFEQVLRSIILSI